MYILALRMTVLEAVKGSDWTSSDITVRLDIETVPVRRYMHYGV